MLSHFVNNLCCRNVIDFLHFIGNQSLAGSIQKYTPYCVYFSIFIIKFYRNILDGTLTWFIKSGARRHAGKWGLFVASVIPLYMFLPKCVLLRCVLPKCILPKYVLSICYKHVPYFMLSNLWFRIALMLANHLKVDES